MIVKDDNKIISIIIGSLVNILIVIASIFLFFKSGISSTIDTAALVLIFLVLVRRFSIKNAVVAEILARGSIAASRQAATYFAALIIFGTANNYEPVRMTILIIISSILGIMFFSTIYSKFEDKKEFSFPMVKPRIDLFNSLKKDSKNNGLLYSLGVTSVYSYIVNIAKLLPKSFKFYNIFGIENNPMLVAIGYLIGYKTYLIMGLGFLYSLFIYKFFESDSFVNHLMSPYIYSSVISIILTQGVITIIGFIKKSNFNKLNKTFFKDGFPKNKNLMSGIIISGFILFNILFFSKLISPTYTMPFWIFLIIIPITLVLSISTLHGVAKTGFWFSALEDILPILIILFTLTQNISAVIMVITSLMVFEISGIYFTINTQFSNSFGISKEHNIVLNIISNIIGALVTVFLVLMIKKTVGLGNDSIPVPFSNTLGMTIKGMMVSLNTGVLPEYINMYIILITSLLCVLLNRFKLSPIVILGGMMLPFTIYLTMSIGAFINYLNRKNVAKNRPIFSGVATADGVISSLAAILGFLR